MEQPHIDRVITIHDYCDGIRLGVATLNDAPCVYESAFYDTGDSSSDLYHLTPIDEPIFDTIMKEWDRWMKWVADHKSAEGWTEQKEVNPQEIAAHFKNHRQYLCHAEFMGSYNNFHTPIENLYVIWRKLH